MRLLLLAALLPIASCASPAPPAPAASGEAPAARAAPPEAGSVRAPIVLRLEGPALAAPGEVVDVDAILTRHGRLQGAVMLVALPGEGIDLLEGRREEQVELGEAEAIARRYRLRIGDPRSSFEVTAILSGDGFGATARKRLSFDGPTREKRDRPRPDNLLLPR
ncbi:MAG TPA: hypothetical protein VN033_12710 [Vulgatibacter sp.]|nr:hypothetical protein [Vulgatibacter sp.]